uniref:Alpha N-terminal protein methyltransferase 1 n=1 Tax=Caenorhabditis tropicalis TaxID=1561998 RepID=A0A1I7T0R7_9PELO
MRRRTESGECCEAPGVMESSTTNPHKVYEKAETFWSRCSQDEVGMLGGTAVLQVPDVTGSVNFLNVLKRDKIVTNFENALDCGAGIGRVTKHVLMPFFKTVDLVDLVEELLATSAEYIGTDDGIGEKFVEGLQTFEPPKRKYDLIWIQWVSGQLTDQDLTSYLERCIEGLAPNGTIVIKESVSCGGKTLYHDTDGCWTRPESLILKLAENAGLKLIHKTVQTGFPKGLYAVKMIALKPVHPVEEDDD